jgi:hypothetical protein
VVGTLGVVEDEPIGQFVVAGVQVGEQQFFVVVDEGLCPRSMKALDVRVPLGCLGVPTRCPLP